MFLPEMSSIVRQFVVSSVLLSVLQCSSAVRFSRSMRYPAPSVRKYYHPLKYVPYSMLPRSMQRRFMWREMDDTVDELMDGVASGARAMTQMFSPSVVRYRKPIDYDTQSSTKVKYVIKKPPPPFKRLKVIKFRAPKKTIQIYNPPLLDVPSPGPSIKSIPSPRPSIIIPYMSEQDLRKIEKEQEKRVEAEHDGGFHEHTHQTHLDDDVVTGRINEFGEGWLPIQSPHSTPKPFAVSQLHTKVEVATVAPPTSSPLIISESYDSSSYEVTEHNAEESVHKDHAFKPSNHVELIVSTTEVPNYPEYFLKNVQKTEDQFKPKRIHTTVNTPMATTSTDSATTLSHRLPPRSTTERPFKRYNLHRPKSSKLFFNRPSSAPSPTKVIQTTTEASIRSTPELLPVIQEPVKSTRESIKTTSTRETLKTTPEPAKAPAEKVRTTRNDSQVKSKINIKNSTQNESSNKTPSKRRGTVKFGEKQS